MGDIATVIEKKKLEIKDYYAPVRKKRVITEELVMDQFMNIKKYLSFFRKYPDKFIDMISPKHCPFKFYFYQRLFLRVVFRYKYVYVTFTRAFSKSFLSILGLFLKCMFYPGIKLFICAGGNV